MSNFFLTSEERVLRSVSGIDIVARFLNKGRAMDDVGAKDRARREGDRRSKEEIVRDLSDSMYRRGLGRSRVGRWC